MNILFVEVITSNLRNAVEGIFWRLRSGSPWRDVPPEFGSWNAIYQLYNRWVHMGVICKLLEAVEGKIDYRTAYIDGSYVHVHQHATGGAKDMDHASGISRGGRTSKIHGICDRKGHPVAIDVTAGNVSDVTHAESIIDDLASVFDEVIADKGYDSDSFRLNILNNGSRPVIPTKSNSDR